MTKVTPFSQSQPAAILDWNASGFANGFAQANAEAIWNPRGEEAKAATAKRRHESRRTMIIVGIIVVAVLLWSLWDEVLSEYFMP